jgi:hypothetical protein
MSSIYQAGTITGPVGTGRDNAPATAALGREKPPYGALRELTRRTETRCYPE